MEYLLWWRGLSDLVRDLLCYEYIGDVDYTTLTDEEIILIYNQEKLT